MIKAVIFDLDGTLANTLNTIAYFANQALLECGYEEIELDKYRYLVGNGADNLVRGMLKTIGQYTEEAFEKVRTGYNQSYDDNFMHLTTAYDGIPELISSLKAMGIKLCVLSNKPHSTTKKIVDELFMDQFDICYGKREDIPRKPDPTAVFDIIEELGVESDECVYIGDTCTDMQTGHNANLFTIGVLWGFRDRQELEEHNADIIASSPFQILEYIVRAMLA
ncbi:MAG: HAD family hydrolase [Oscillospiraceae bacterium]